MVDLAVGEPRAQPVEHGDRIGRCAVVVTHQGIEAVGVGADHRDSFGHCLQWQQVALVLEQDHGRAGHVQRLGVVLGRVEILTGDPGPWQGFVRIEHAELHPRREQSNQRAVENVGRKYPPLDRLDDLLRFGRQIVAIVAADHVHPADEAQRHAIHPVGLVGQRILAIDIGGTAAVGDDVAFETPLPAQPFLHQELAGTGRHAVQRVIGAHHRADLAVDHGGTEGRQKSFLEILRRRVEILLVAPLLRPAVHGEMLGRGDGLVIPGIVALQAGDERIGDLSGQVWILAIGFLAASPAWIAEDVDVGRPHRQPLVEPAGAVGLQRLEVLGAKLGRDDLCRLVHPLGVPGGGHADRLRKDRRDACAGDAMESFVPPVVGGHAEPRNRGRGVPGLARLLLEGHARDQILRAGREIERGIAIGGP